MISVRPGDSADISRAAALELQPDTARWLGRTGEAWHESALADPAQDYLIAEDSGALVGFIVLAGLHHPEWIVELRRIIVSAPRRGSGCGRTLLRSALARAYEHHGAQRVWLDVKTQNLKARTLYRSEGFRDVAPEFVAVKALPVTTTETGQPDPDLIVMVHSPGSWMADSKG